MKFGSSMIWFIYYELVLVLPPSNLLQNQLNVFVAESFPQSSVVASLHCFNSSPKNGITFFLFLCFGWFQVLRHGEIRGNFFCNSNWSLKNSFCCFSVVFFLVEHLHLFGAAFLKPSGVIHCDPASSVRATDEDHENIPFSSFLGHFLAAFCYAQFFLFFGGWIWL